MFNGKKRFGLATLACVSLAIAFSAPAAAWKRGAVQTFALVPTGGQQVLVEGLAVGPDGKVYSPTFHLCSGVPCGENSKLFTFDPQGRLLKQVTIAGSSSAMLGLAVIPGTTNALLVIDFGAGQVLSVDPNNGSTAAPCITLDNPPGTPGLNALTFDTAGNTYISDSFNGIIWKLTGTACGKAEIWAQGDVLKPDGGVPGFGANGIEFNSKFDTMFVCNTAMDWIVEIPVADPTSLSVFTNSINGCDGIAIDGSDNIWAAANQADEIVVVSSTGDSAGKVLAKLGDFDGIQGGVTNGLLFPASPAFSPDGKWLYVTNLELDLRTLGPNNMGGPQAVDSQWAAEVTQHSIARLTAKIPPIQSTP